jgi:hypothetical protein
VDDRPAGDPFVRDLFTADPAALVHEGRLYVFTGRDEAPDTLRDFVMREWHAFSTDAPWDHPDAWEHHGALLCLEDFAWADRHAWAAEVVRGPDGRSYWFVSVRWADAPRDGDRMSVGVAVADHPLGPYRDAIGGPLVTALLDNASSHTIDPTVLVADDAVHLYWGSFWEPRYVRLTPSMTALEGPVSTPEGLDGFLHHEPPGGRRVPRGKRPLVDDLPHRRPPRRRGLPPVRGHRLPRLRGGRDAQEGPSDKGGIGGNGGGPPAAVSLTLEVAFVLLGFLE